jgi:hypothetical protein
MKPDKLFLDLDGVLVDFESGIYDTIKKFYKNENLFNSLEEEDKKNVAMMFLDMEQEGKTKAVVAEFLKDPETKETLRALLGKEDNWWGKLSWMPDGKELWNYIKRYNPTILTSGFHKTNSTEGKKVWVKNHLGPNVKIIVADNKGDFAKSNYLLVDDRQFVLDGFIEAGGDGLLHKNSKDTIKNLEKIYSITESFKYIKSFKNWNLND